ncbi:hypothetical protein [Haloglomus litoreum]|uniref:hypothetical protein n=1 Tax=Haloglomus litoreum TaxID=3034026 RepID=UPI0023E817CB|nr:hypothetical protein [Haloglomus sp. DT116]
MGSTRSISFRKRDEVDEIYTFPYEVQQSTLQIRNAAVMVEYLDDGDVLIIAANLPGVAGYFDNYPDVEGEDKKRRHNLSHELVPYAEEHLSEYDPKTSTSKANSGNRAMEDIYVTVAEEQRDEVVMKMWRILNHLKERYIESLQESDESEYYDYPSLEGEVLDISKRIC